MSLKTVTIAHYKSLSSGEIAPPGLDYRLPLDEPCHQEMLERFGAGCDLTQARHINWAQSFARRGYVESDYRHEHSEPLRDFIEHGFRRVAGADSALPEVLAFKDPWVGTLADGDVLFYFSTISVLHASRVFVTNANLKVAPESLMDRALRRTWVCRRLEAIALSNSAASLKHLHTEVTVGWDDARSFLAVSL
jgi:hypothetical protein